MAQEGIKTMTLEELRSTSGMEWERRNAFHCRLLVCHSSPCRAAGAEAVYDALVEAVKERNLDTEVEVTCTGCTARCTDGPLVTICVSGKEDVIYENVTPECIIPILEELVHGRKMLEK